MPRYWADSVFHIPYLDTAQLLNPNGSKARAGALQMRPQDSSLYVWNGDKWDKVNPTQLTDSSFVIAGDTIVISGTGGGGATSPGGSTTQIQYNDAGAFAGDAGLTYDDATNTLATDSVYGQKIKLNVPGTIKPDTVYFFGNSITFGVGATSNRYRWTSLLSYMLGAVEKNFGVSGSTMQKRTPVDPFGVSSVNMQDRLYEIPAYGVNSRGIFVSYGQNDYGYTGANYTTANFKIDYKVFIDTCIARGWPTNKIFLLTPGYLGAQGYTNYGLTTGLSAPTRTRHLDFNTAVQELSTENSTNFVDIYNSQLRNDSSILIGPDFLHPNNGGHAMIAQTVYSTIVDSVVNNTQAIAANGMVELSRLKIRNVDTANKPTILGLDSAGNVVATKPGEVVRGYTLSSPQAVNFGIRGKAAIGNYPFNNDVENVLVSGGVKMGYGRFREGIPGGLRDSAVEIGMFGATTGLIGAYNRTTSTALNLSVQPLGGNFLLGSLSAAGSQKLQVTGGGYFSTNLIIGSTAAPTVGLEVQTTNAVRIASGTSAQRPTGAAGYLRWNTDSTAFELYDGSAWRCLATRKFVTDQGYATSSNVTTIIRDSAGYYTITGTTTDATPTALSIIPVTIGYVTSIEATCVAITAGGDDGLSGIKHRAYHKASGGTLTSMAPTTIAADSYVGGGLSTATFTLTSSGTDAAIQVTGEAATTINWKIRYKLVSINVSF